MFLVPALASATLAALSTAPSSAGAQEAGGDQVGVGSDGARVTITGYRAGGVVHADVAGRGAAGVALVCRELIDSTDGWVDFDAVADWPPLDPGRRVVRRFWVSCALADGTPVALAGNGLGYLYADQVVDVDAVVRTLAQRYSAEHLGPAVAVSTSPPEGLVGVAQWFWVHGVEREPVLERHDVVGHAVVLRLEVAEVRWDFGDGGEAVVLRGPDGLGTAGADAVQHRYRDRSTSVGEPAGAYAVTATVQVAVSYTLDGAGPYQVDPPLSASTTMQLRIREAQAVLHPLG